MVAIRCVFSDLCNSFWMCAFCLPRTHTLWKLIFITQHTVICNSYFLSSWVHGLNDCLVNQCASVSKKTPSLKLFASGKIQAYICQCHMKNYRMHSIVKVRNCWLCLSSVKCVWTILARWANSSCLWFSGLGFLDFGSSPLQTLKCSQRNSKPSLWCFCFISNLSLSFIMILIPMEETVTELEGINVHELGPL